jgi:hypothetical protein
LVGAVFKGFADAVDAEEAAAEEEAVVAAAAGVEAALAVRAAAALCWSRHSWKQANQSSINQGRRKARKGVDVLCKT